MESAEETVLSQEERAREEGGPDASAGRAPFLGWVEGTQAVPLGFARNAEPLVVDWTGRGRADLLVTGEVASAGFATRIFRRSDSSTTAALRFEPGEALPTLDGLHFLGLLPNGRPTRFDLVGIGASGLVFLPNQGEPAAPAFPERRPLGDGPELGLGRVRIAQVVGVDWDGDGLTDLLVGFDGLEGYWADEGEAPRAQLLGFNQLAGHPGYDRKGQWRGRPPQPRVAWLRNVGNFGEPRFLPAEELELGRGFRPRSRPVPLLAQWTGRGAHEFLLADASGEVRRFRNFGGQRPPVLMESHPLHRRGEPFVVPEDRTSIVAGDLDGDGRDELIIGRADGRVLVVRAGGQRDEVREPEPLLARPETLWLGGGAVVAAGDLDGDDGLDLVVGDASGRLRVVMDQGGPSAHRYEAPRDLCIDGEPFLLDPGPDGVLGGPVAPRLGFACPTLVDWSEDGRLDLIVGGAGGEVVFLQNVGTAAQPRFAAPRPILCKGVPLYTPPRVRLASVDWNASGHPDLIGLDLQGFLCVYPRLGALEVDDPAPLLDRLGRLIRLDGGFGLSGRCSLWAGPFAGSGRLDLLVGLARDARFLVPGLTGEPLDNLDDASTVLLLENAGRNVLIPRQVRLADGRPLVAGHEGCSPCGVRGPEGSRGLLVGSDDGRLAFYRRDQIQW